MSDVCIICGTPDPRWVQSIDSTVGDMLWRITKCSPGPNSISVRYCEDPACEAAVEAIYPPGNEAALARLRQLPMHANEERTAALIEHLIA